MTPEGVLKASILQWLNAQPGCYAKIVQVRGMRGRRSPTKGFLDIAASFWGLAVAIEVKMPGRPLENSQADFIASWTIRGRGISIIARSLEDVIRVFESQSVRRMIQALRKVRSEIGDEGPFDFGQGRQIGPGLALK
jgi:hypothetical protein